MHLVELERLFVQLWPLADAFELPRRDVREIRVVAQRLAVWRLTFFPEMSAAGFPAFERIECEQFTELEIVGDATRVLEALIQIVRRPGHRDGMPELFAQLRNGRERAPEAVLRPRHPDVVPHD